MKMLYDKVLILEDEKETQVGSIILAKALDKPIKTGVVAACGPVGYDDNGREYPTEVQVGDRVIIGRYTGYEVMHEDRPHLMCRTHEIMAKVC